jgi:ATP-dependent exoDNAse (exonuclease V) beta subunit
MTVHAAKGLEFDAVFLPELGGALSREPAELLTHRPDPARLIEAICIKPAARVAALSTDLDMLYTNAKGRLLAEALSLLYVGMTRARYGLEMIVPSPASGSASRSGKASASVLLAETLGAGEPDTGGILWQHPESDEDSPWACDQQVTTPAVVAPPLPRGLGLREAATPRGVVMRSPSDRESFGSGPSGSGIADLLRAPGRHALRLGTLVHRLFEEIEWLEDLHASDATLDNLLAPQEADRTTRRQALEIFRHALTHSEVAALLSRASHPGEREVLRERPFCTELPEPDGTTVLWNGTIDRMVIQRLNGKPVGVDVIDFKSDRIDHQAVATRSAVYRSQMAVYARVVAAQTQLAATTIRTHLVFLVPGRVYTS